MSNNNEENRSYPLNVITRMRKKDDRRKKILKITLTTICFMLCFVIGFVSGFYYNDSGKYASKPAIATSSDKGIASSGASSDGDKNDSSNTAIAYTESIMLEELKVEFTNRMSVICPEAEFSFGIKNLDTGEVMIHNNIQMNSASVIKLFIMETIYKEVAAGNYELTDQRKEALFKMITDSDNEASNMFIDDFGGIDDTRKIKADNTINKTIKNSGYKYTEANRKMYNTTPPGGPTGYENYTCAEDVIKLLEGIFNGTLFEDDYNKEALNLLKQQKRLEKIPAKINEVFPDVIVANKTGELTQVENDVALIMCEDFNIAFAVFISNIPKTEAGNYDAELHKTIRETIADFGLEIVSRYKANKF